MSDTLIQLRKRQGLGKLLKNAKAKGNGLATLRLVETKDGNETGNTSTEAYKGKMILNTIQGVCPIYSTTARKYAFGGTEKDFARLVDAMALVYPDTHARRGEIIRSKEVKLSTEQVNMKSPVFSNKVFFTHFIENDRLTLNLGDPTQEFLHFCLKGDDAIRDENSTKKYSKFATNKQQLELVSLSGDNKRQAKLIDAEMKATELFIGISDDFDKLRSIAGIMKLPGYSAKIADPNAAKTLMYQFYRDTEKKHKRFGGKTYQEYFVELCEMSDADRFVYETVAEGIRKGVVRVYNNHTQFKESRLDGIYTHNAIMHYFAEVDNREKFNELVDALDS